MADIAEHSIASLTESDDFSGSDNQHDGDAATANVDCDIRHHPTAAKRRKNEREQKRRKEVTDKISVLERHLVSRGRSGKTKLHCGGRGELNFSKKGTLERGIEYMIDLEMQVADLRLQLRACKEASETSMRMDEPGRGYSLQMSAPLQQKVQSDGERRVWVEASLAHEDAVGVGDGGPAAPRRQRRPSRQY